jgi:uncharacterized metal-binding protein YceD (DUF177 family)
MEGMKGRLIIDVSVLPEEGREYVGALPVEVFDLPKGDAVPEGELAYDLFAKRFESELLLTGTLSASFEFTCVRTLHPFVQTIFLEAVAISLEIGHQVEMDVTEALREEVLLHFPTNPRCDEADAPQECQIDPRYLSVDKTGWDELPTPPRDGGDDRWSALDRLSDLPDQP